MTKKIDSLYIHFPFCLHLCNYCDFFKRKSDASKSDLDFFEQFLIQSFKRHEILTKEYGYSFVPLKTLYIGGGTPSLWGESGAHFLKQFLADREIVIDKDCEFTLEVNPKAWTERSIAAFESAGVNRFSIGVQTLNNNLLPLLDRTHNIDDVFETLDFFSKRRANFSVDFMLGLPSSAKHGRNIEDELKHVLQFNPQHFSVYILTVKSNYKHFTTLPHEDWIHDEYLKTADFLLSNGFNHYEVSNFSRPSRESQHNLNYWRSHTVAALGASATGFLAEDRLRYKWKTQEEEIEIEKLTEKEFGLEKIYMSLRSDIGLSRDALSKGEHFDVLAKKWSASGYLKSLTADKLQLNSHGFLMLDSLMNDLFNYLE